MSQDLLDFQNDAVLFNIGQVAQTDHQVEVALTPALPGAVIPSCTGGAQEGCITANATFTGSTNLMTSFAGGIVASPSGCTGYHRH